MISVDFDKNHWIKVWNKASSECSLYNLSSLSRDSSFYLQVITLPVSIATGISGKPSSGLGGGGGNLTSWQPLAQVSLAGGQKWFSNLFELHEGRMEGRRECRRQGVGLGWRLEGEEVKQCLASILESWQASASSENTHKPRSSSSVAEDAKGADETHSVSGYVQMARAFPLRSWPAEPIFCVAAEREFVSSPTSPTTEFLPSNIPNALSAPLWIYDRNEPS